MSPFRLHADAAGAATTLGPGPAILEASAGTGKTYTIAGLVARLVLEEGLPIERIAVLTFTEAATSELRDRIRARIAAIERAVEAGPAGADAFTAALLAGHEALPLAGRQQWRKRLRQAAAAVDLARISTLHGFARRLGIEHAAALGLDAGAEPTTDLEPWRMQVVHDWIRRHLRTASAGLVGLFGANPAARLLGLAKQAELAPHAVVAEAAATPADAASAIAALAARWSEVRRRVTEVLVAREKDISGSSIFPPTRAGPRLATLDALFAGDGADPAEVAKAGELALPEKLAKAVLKGRKPLDAAPFTALGELVAAWQLLGPQVLAGFIADYRAALAARPQSAGSGHVDDPLRALDAGVARDPALAARIGASLDAVLVDEFQDTDLRQWRILQRCFATARHRLVLIGDPKQAIYRFRGADVHAYLAARDAVPAARRFTLDVNHRSDRGLVAAVSALYLGRDGVEAVAEPFALAGISYLPVTARHGDRFDAGHLDRRPLQVVRLAEDLAGSAEDALLATAAAVADEAGRLLDPANRVRLREGEAMRTLAPGDIAVLVRTHVQGERVARALARRGIPCVRSDRASVFAGDMALELAALLAGCLDPQSEAAVRGAAATRLVGAPAAALATAAPGLAALPRHLAELGAELREHGLAAWWYQAQDRDLGWGTPRLRVSALADAQRHLADLHQLVELAAAAQAADALPADALGRWLGRRIAAASGSDGDDLRRLERDDAAVRVVTVFGAKGLQYPVVFDAFAWGSAHADDRDGLLVHGADGGLGWHLGEADALAGRAATEALGDDLRKLYVGLTRAMHRCYAVWAPLPARGSSKGCTRSALGLLLFGRDLAADDAMAATLEGRIAAAGDPAWLERIGVGVQAVDVLPPPQAWTPPAAQGPAAPDAAVLPAIQVRRSWARSSFTALARRIEAEEGRDHDGFAVPAPADDGLAAGAAFGTAVHHLYEHADLAAWSADPAALAAQVAAALAVDGAAATAFASRLRATVHLAVPGIGTPLAALPPSAVAREWPVRLPVAPGHPSLATAFAGRLPQAPGWSGRLAGLHLASGVFEGVIDAVAHAGGRWHVIDWKTNRLDAYDEASLLQAMAGHDYLLQAHLYLVAVHRWLRLRLGESYRLADHLGVAAYAFVRGADPARPGAGWYVITPDPALIEDLDACFA